MEEIKSGMLSVNNLFVDERKIFHIPDFQREFVWGKEEAEELINDFLSDTEDLSLPFDELQGYLLGNIVLIEDSKQYLVVDGQQRITTLTLLFKALHEKTKKILEETEGEERDKWLTRMGQLNFAYEVLDEEDNFKGLRVIHSDSLAFGKYYRNIIRNIEKTDIDTSSDNNISVVYETILEKLEDLTEKQIYKFIPYLKNKVKLIVTTSSSEGKAFQLFEVLNDRGRSLEPMDLIKNNFLKKLNLDGYNKEEIESFNENWKNFLGNLSVSKKRKISSSTFMKHFLICDYAVNLKQDKLFDYFKNDEVFSSSRIKSLATDLARKSKIYTSIQKDPLTNEFLKNDKNLYIIFKILRIKQLHPILMAFYEADEEIKKEVTSLLARYGASVVFSFQQTNMIEKELPVIMKEINKGKNYEDKLNIVDKEISKRILLSMELLENTIKSKNFINSNGKPLTKSMDILRFIELYYISNNLVINPNKNLSLEHILATKTHIENFNDYGFVDSNDLGKSLNKIGNLALLYNDENASAGNQDIKDKKIIYQTSDYKLTRLITEELKTPIKNGKETEKIDILNKYLRMDSNNDKWTKEDIDLRSEKIAIFLKKILRKEI
ncbi:DUF262 domain-containing protein [Enterococcus thailandicus]|uniref:DUF262 domain-containing protein n=1 Tax=Enterococcus thailandicus TaxID=417368 RepID=UPI00244D979A|nr:DUF262 domain-containing protein [Enterococcus thailandicus]GMC01025.1 hypothetical protein K2F_12840 [Enterococcus thailandicus]